MDILKIIETTAKGIETVTKGIGVFCKKNAPEICLAATITAAVSTAVVASNMGTKIAENNKRAEEEKGEPLTKWEKIKNNKKELIFISIPVAATVGSAYAGYKVQKVRLVQAIAAGSALLATNKELQEQIASLSEIPEAKQLLDKKEEEKAITATEAAVMSGKAIDTGLGTDRFYDSFLGITFLNDVDVVLSGIEGFQEQYEQEQAVDISDLYKFWRVKDQKRLGEVTKAMGWYQTCETDPFEVPLINVKKKVVLDDNGVDHGCYIISYAPSNMCYDYALGSKPSYINVGGIASTANKLKDEMEDHEYIGNINDLIFRPGDIEI